MREARVGRVLRVANRGWDYDANPCGRMKPAEQAISSSTNSGTDNPIRQVSARSICFESVVSRAS